MERICKGTTRKKHAKYAKKYAKNTSGKIYIFFLTAKVTTKTSRSLSFSLSLLE